MKSIVFAGLMVLSATASAGTYWKGFKAQCKDVDEKIVVMVDEEKLFLQGHLTWYFPKENMFGTVKSIRSQKAVEDIRYEMPIEVVAEAKSSDGFPHKITVEFDRRLGAVTMFVESFQKDGRPANKFRHGVRCDSLTYSF